MAGVIPRTSGPELGPREQLVLSRASFGPTPDTRADLLEMGWEAWLDAQLNPDTVDDAELEAMVEGYEMLGLSNKELGTRRRNQVDNEVDQRIVGELRHNAVLRARHSRRQLREVLVDFWTNHLNVYLLDQAQFRHLHVESDQSVIRPHVLGRFADLLAASAHSPAMLVYLDNYRSNANSPEGVNENYGRELLELHTLGIVDGIQPYGESDMVAVAKVLSGWSIDTDGQNDIFFRYRANIHSNESQSVLDGAWSSGGNGYDDGVELLDFLAHHELTSRHVAWKLIQRFVADDPTPELVDSAAQIYRDNDTAIAPVVRHIFHSDAFEASLGAKLRRPFDQVSAALRATNAEIDPDPVGPASQLMNSDKGVLAIGGQLLFGHQPPDGYPDTIPDWVSADGMLRRWELAGRLVGNRFGRQRGISVDTAGLLPAHRPPTAGQLVDSVANRLLLVGDAVPPHPFTDVTTWVDQAVDWLVWMDVASGYPDGTYRPNNPVTRAEVTNWLWKLADQPGDHPRHGFTDVPSWIDTAVSWLVAVDVASGYPDGTYRPNNPVTRAEVTNWLWKLADQPGGHPRHGFTDVPSWIDTAVSWLVAVDVASGYPDGTYRPNNPVTRAEVTNWLWGLYHQPARVLDDADREPLVAWLGGEDHPITQAELEEAVPDLPALILATPSFQFR